MRKDNRINDPTVQQQLPPSAVWLKEIVFFPLHCYYLNQTECWKSRGPPGRGSVVLERGAGWWCVAPGGFHQRFGILWLDFAMVLFSVWFSVSAAWG